jgi:hypothetical protein
VRTADSLGVRGISGVMGGIKVAAPGAAAHHFPITVRHLPTLDGWEMHLAFRSRSVYLRICCSLVIKQAPYHTGLMQTKCDGRCYDSRRSKRNSKIQNSLSPNLIVIRKWFSIQAKDASHSSLLPPQILCLRFT